MHSARVTAVALVAVALVVAPRGRAEEPCSWVVDYAMNEDLAITNTPMGEGNGVYPTGPGKVVLRFDGQRVQMLSYSMNEHVRMKAHTLTWTTTVTSDTVTAATPDPCGVAAEGVLEGNTVRWTTPVRGVHTDGVITCSGSLCGKFGSPPPGRSEFHVPARAVRYSPFVFSPDRETFTMQKTHVVDTTMPKQSSSVSLAARETGRTCTQAPACK